MSGEGDELVLEVGLAPGVTLTWGGLAGPTGETRLRDGALIDALQVGAPIERLVGIATPRAGRDARGVLDVLHRRQLLAWFVRGDRPWATIVPLRADVPLPDLTARPAGGQPTDSAQLSRFALLRSEAGGWLLESGRSPFAATLSGDAATALTAGSLPAALRSALQAAGLLADSDDDSARYWEFHDRYFASRSRTTLRPHGATYRFAGGHDPEPAGQRPPVLDQVVMLPVPPAEEGPGVWDVTHQRRSVREYAAEPVSIDRLGALLWHTLRVQRSHQRDASVRTSYDAEFRAVASAGATHSIGLWLWCRNVAGVDPGAWWYDARDHALRRVDVGPTDSLPARAADAPTDTSTAPVHGVLLCQHARLAWKYERIAHALALKDAGVIVHALQLAATALGLGMCPSGMDSASGMFTRLGLTEDDYVPMGEFWLGVPATHPASARENEG